jgi:metal-responsive CopG/Arc/MetJ family transcriptional regulator
METKRVSVDLYDLYEPAEKAMKADKFRTWNEFIRFLIRDYIQSRDLKSPKFKPQIVNKKAG